MKHSPARLRSGFTLVELLVSIGIVVVLVSLGFPIMNSASDRSKEAACLGHAKQLSVAYMTFRTDNNGSVNGLGKGLDGSNWMNRMTPYFSIDKYEDIRSKYICPAHPQFLKNSASHFGWAINSNFNVASTPFIPFTKVSNPSKVIYAIEGFRTYDWSKGDGQDPNFVAPTAFLKADTTVPPGQEVLFPHHKGSVAIFVDGHIELMKAPLARETWAIDGI